MAIQRQGGTGSGPGSDNSPESIEPNPGGIAPLPSPEAPDDLENFPAESEEEPSLLDEPEIPEKCLKDMDVVLKDGMGNYPAAAAMAKAAPDNFKYLFHEYWEDAKNGNDEERTWGIVSRIEKEIKDRQ